MDLTDKVVIVTGGAQGLGRATVEAFVEAGAHGVVIADVQADEAVMVAREISATGNGQVIAVPTDVADPAQIEALASDRSSYITGHELWVDGGWSLG